MEFAVYSKEMTLGGALTSFAFYDLYHTNMAHEQ